MTLLACLEQWLKMIGEVEAVAPIIIYISSFPSSPANLVDLEAVEIEI